MYANAMLDIETLGTGPYAPVLSVGIVLFNDDEDESYDDLVAADRSIYRVLDAGDQPDRKFDYRTICWWMGQNAMAKQVFSDTPRPTAQALTEIHNFLAPYRNLLLWANPPAFDAIILQTLFRAHDMELPFPYYMWRDLRTVKALVPNSVYAGIAKNVDHNALDDAAYQVEVLRACLDYLNGKETRSHVRVFG